MEFKKTRERAREERDRTRPPTQVPVTAALSEPLPVPTVPPQRAPSSSMLPSRVHNDPLADFLAVYDEGGAAVHDGVEALAPDDERRFLSFELAGEPYAASIMDIREILKLVALTEVPRAPREVLGVLSKRGVVMPVVDLASLLGLRAPERDIRPEHRVLVVSDRDRLVGLRVDRVRQVVRLAQRAIEEVPLSLGSRNSHMLIGLGRARLEGAEVPQMLILLDVDAVLQQLADALGLEARAPQIRRDADA